MADYFAIGGHSVFSESDVWAAKIETERGPVVRVWEYDRNRARNPHYNRISGDMTREREIARGCRAQPYHLAG